MAATDEHSSLVDVAMITLESEQTDHSSSGDADGKPEAKVECISIESENKHHITTTKPSVGADVGKEIDKMAEVESIFMNPKPKANLLLWSKPKRKMKKPTKKRKRGPNQRESPAASPVPALNLFGIKPSDSPRQRKRTKFNHGTNVAPPDSIMQPICFSRPLSPIGTLGIGMSGMSCASPKFTSTKNSSMKNRLSQLKYSQSRPQTPSQQSSFPQPIFQMTRNMAHAQSIPHTRVDKNFLIREKKLFLILDIDHTIVHTFPQIIHSSPTVSNSPKMLHQSTRGNQIAIPDLPNFFEDVYPFHAQGLAFWIKLRPHCKEMIKKLSETFIIAFYTQGKTGYAKEIKKILDPENKYIMGGVLGQTVKQEHKSVDKFVQVFQHTIPRDMLLVADDRLDVWQPEQRHHILSIKKFEFWPLNQNGHPLPLKINALQNDNVTRAAQADKILQQLIQVCSFKHQQFFAKQNGAPAKSPFCIVPEAFLPKKSPPTSQKQPTMIRLKNPASAPIAQNAAPLPLAPRPKPTNPPDPELMKKWIQV